MNSYILLRNNKESGPLVLKDLEQSGLYSTDLIWVECQSVCWQSPSEVPELRKLIQDQPDFDLRNVQKYMPYPYAEQSGKQDIQLGASGMTASRSLDEIKEIYAKNLEERKRKQTAVILNLPEWAKKAMLYAGLILLGAATVLLVNRDGKKLPSIAEEKTVLPANLKTRPDTIIAEEVTDPGISQNSATEITDPVERSVAENSKPLSTLSATLPSKPEQKIKPVEKKAQPVEEKVKEELASTLNNEVPEIKKPSANSITSQVTVKSNNYTIAALGGIRDLEMTLQNDSKYQLDKVTVELSYLNPVGTILKTEDIDFKNLEPNSSKTVAVKKSTRGVKVSYKIKQIESRELGHTAGL